MKVKFQSTTYPSTSSPSFKTALVAAGATNYVLRVVEYEKFDAGGKLTNTEALAIVEAKP